MAAPAIPRETVAESITTRAADHKTLPAVEQLPRSNLSSTSKSVDTPAAPHTFWPTPRSPTNRPSSIASQALRDDPIKAVLEQVGLGDFKDQALMTLRDAHEVVLSAASDVMIKTGEVFAGVQSTHAAEVKSQLHKLDAPRAKPKTALASNKPVPVKQQEETKDIAINSRGIGLVNGLCILVCIMAVFMTVMLQQDAAVAKAVPGKGKERAFFRSPPATSSEKGIRGGTGMVKLRKTGKVETSGSALMVSPNALVQEMSAAASGMSLAATASLCDISAAASSSLLDMSLKASAVAAASMSAVSEAVQGKKAQPPKKRGFFARLFGRKKKTV